MPGEHDEPRVYSGLSAGLDHKDAGNDAVLELLMGRLSHSFPPPFLHHFLCSARLLFFQVGNIIPAEYCIKHNISRSWHTQTWPRTMYHK